jgi:hypothetical protein
LRDETLAMFRKRGRKHDRDRHVPST